MEKWVRIIFNSYILFKTIEMLQYNVKYTSVNIFYSYIRIAKIETPNIKFYLYVL